MSTKKNYGERLEGLKKKIDELRAQERILQHKQAEADRKQRTKRLIELGAAVESVLRDSLGEDGGKITKEDLPALINFLRQQEERGCYFSKAITTGRVKRQAAETVDDTGDTAET